MPNIPPVQVEIKPSSIFDCGVGLFAARDLEEGTIIGRQELIKENYHPWSDYQSLDDRTKRMVNDFCVGTISGFYAPDDFNYMSAVWFMNHGCDGNIGFDKVGNFVTIKKVLRGEELLWDYGLLETNPAFNMKCRCGSEKCRGTITGNDWKQLRLIPEKARYMSEELTTKANV